MKKGTIKLMTLLTVGLMVFASCGGSSEADIKAAQEKAAKQLEDMGSKALADETWACAKNCEDGKTYTFGGVCPECYGKLELQE